MRKILISALVFTLLHSEAWARGGSCGEFCSSFEPIIVLVLIVAFLSTLGASIAKHGLAKGIARHLGIRALVVYGGILLAAGIVWWVGFEMFGKAGVIGAFVLVMVVGYYVSGKIPPPNVEITPEQERNRAEYLERLSNTGHTDSKRIRSKRRSE